MASFTNMSIIIVSVIEFQICFQDSYFIEH